MNTSIIKSIIAVMVLSSSWSQAATLIHRYEFGNNLNDSAGSINGVAASGGSAEAPSYVTAAPNGAVGLSQSLYVGQNVGSATSGFTLNNGAINATQGSLSLWINPAEASAGTGDDYILNFPNPWATTGAGFAIYIPANTLNLGAVVANKSASGGTGALAQNSWTNVVLTWDGSAGSWKFYVNGVLKATTAYAGITSTSDLNIGSYGFSTSQTSLNGQYSGYIYDLQIYDGVLNSSDVSYLYSNPGLAVVPEPHSLSLLGLGGGVLVLAWGLRKNNLAIRK